MLDNAARLEPNSNQVSNIASKLDNSFDAFSRLSFRRAFGQSSAGKVRPRSAAQIGIELGSWRPPVPTSPQKKLALKFLPEQI